MNSGTTHDGRIGRYRLVKRLAVGGMADIYLAQQTGPRGYERTVVVKTIRSDLVDEEELVHLLMEEARIASCLRHKNIVELYEVGQQSGTHFLSMEFVFGRDLGQIRDRCIELGERIPSEHVATVLADVLDALHYAHHDAQHEGRPLGVVHRDVSPQNIMIGFDGGVKLLDFGLAKAAAQLSRTRAGVLKGKYAYMSPEQVNFRGVDQRADIFSVGIVLWEMLTQRRLFYRVSDYETVKAVMACQTPFPRSVRRDVPWWLAWAAYRALSKNPRWRYHTSRKMRGALLRNNRLPREVARDRLAEWMGHLFSEELHMREQTLARARSNPSRHRELQDAGFELMDDPAARERLGRRASSPPSPRAEPRSENHQSPDLTDAKTQSLGVIGAALATWKWFLLVFAALVFLGVASGVYIGASQGTAEPYGFLSVRSAGSGVSVTVGGRPLGPAPVENILVLPGRHRVVASYGEMSQVREVVVEAGSRREVVFDLPPKASPRVRP